MSNSSIWKSTSTLDTTLGTTLGTNLGKQRDNKEILKRQTSYTNTLVNSKSSSTSSTSSLTVTNQNNQNNNTFPHHNFYQSAIATSPNWNRGSVCPSISNKVSCILIWPLLCFRLWMVCSVSFRIQRMANKMICSRLFNRNWVQNGSSTIFNGSLHSLI